MIQTNSTTRTGPNVVLFGGGALTHLSPSPNPLERGGWGCFWPPHLGASKKRLYE